MAESSNTSPVSDGAVNEERIWYAPPGAQVLVGEEVVELLRKIQQCQLPEDKKHRMIRLANGFMQIVVPADAPEWLKDQGHALWDSVIEWRNSL